MDIDRPESYVNHGLEISEHEVDGGSDKGERIPEEATARINYQQGEVKFTKNPAASEQTSLLSESPATVAVSFFVNEKIKQVYSAISISDTLHKVVYASLVANFILYAQTYLGSTPQNSIIFLHLFISICLLTSAITAITIQSWSKILLSILIGFVTYIIGVALIAGLSRHILLSHSSRLWSILAFYLICLGEALTSINFQELGAMQFSNREMEQFGNYAYKIYWVSSLSSLVAIGTITALEQFRHFDVAFYICVSALAVGSFLFLIQWKNYKRCRVTNTSSLKILYKIIREAKMVKTSTFVTEGESNISVEQDSTFQKPQGCLGFATIKYGGTYNESDIKEASSLMNFAVFMACLIPYWIVYAQCYSTYYYQGLHLDTSIGLLHVPVAWVGLCCTILVIVLSPILDRIIYPALSHRGMSIPITWRILLGMLLALLSVLIAGCIEVAGISAMRSNETITQEIGKAKFVAVKISIFCQVPQYCLLGLSEAFTSLTALSIAHKLCKGTFRRLATSIYYLTIAAGHLLALFFVSLGWFPNETYFATTSVQNYFFFLAGLLALSIIIFASVVYWLIDTSLTREIRN